MWRQSTRIASRLPQLGLRSITTKQPTKSTAAAAKLEDFDELEEQHHQQQQQQQQQEQPSRRRWQSPTTPISVVEPEPLPVHTCETFEEREERLRSTFFQYDKTTDKVDTLPAHEWRGIFNLITRTEGMSNENIQLMRTIIDVDTEALYFYKDQMMWLREVEDQTLRLTRLRALGADLAAAHFIVFRDGRVRFHGQAEWYCRDPDNDTYDLPRFKTPGLLLKDVDASDMKLVYEGLQNLDGCQTLESINLSRSPHVDNWFVDRICYQHCHSLLSLDLSYCPHITVGAITALARLPKLKRLNVTGLNIEHLPLACLTLEEELPGLEIIGINFEEQQTSLNEEQVEETLSYLKDLQSLKDGTFDKTL